MTHRPPPDRSIPFPAFLVLLLLATVVSARGQEGADSLAFERMIADADGARPFNENARRILARRLVSGDDVGGLALLGFMDRRLSTDPRPWLDPAERLYAHVILADRSLIADTSRLGPLLATADIFGTGAPYGDGLFRNERDILRRDVEKVAERFDAGGPTNEERRFFNLLLNHLIITGYRAQSALNGSADGFTAGYPTSRYNPLIASYIRKEYSEHDYGVAFSAGYTGGAFGGELGDRFGKFHGAMLSGEIYATRLTFALTLQLCVAASRRDFAAGADFWSAGDASFVNFTLDGGYEFRMGRLALTPLAGLAVQSMRGAEEAPETEAPRTRSRYGYDLGLLVGYRIPFDLGPHIDLRMKLGRSAAALGDYDAGFTGAAYYAQFGFALVYRPYRGRARGRE